MQVSNKNSKKTLLMLFLLLALIAIVVYFGKDYIALKQQVTHNSGSHISLQTPMSNFAEHEGANPQATNPTAEVSAEQTKPAIKLQGQDLLQVKQAYFLTQLAQDRLRYAHDLPAAKQFLQAAQEQLANINAPELSALKSALLQVETTLNAQPAFDIDQLQTKLDALEKQLPTLSTQQQFSAQKQENKNVPQASNLEPGVKGYVSNMLSYFKSMIKVRKQSDPDLGVLSLNEEISRSQLKLQIEQMRWASFYQDEEVFQNSIKRAQETLKAVFANANPSTQKFAQELDELAKIKLQPEVPNLQDTLKGFHSLLIG